MINPIEKYRARIDELESLKNELSAAHRPGDPAPVVGRLLEAAGDLLRRRQKVPVPDATIDAALAAVPERGLVSWVDGVKADDVRQRVERAADQAVDATLPEADGDGATLSTWAMQALLARDRLESARVAVERMAKLGRPAASVTASRLETELLAADAQSRRCCTRLTALNQGRRDELGLLDAERRTGAWWLSEQSGLEHDLVIKVLAGEARGSLSTNAQAAHELVMQKRARRFSFDELLRFDLGLASESERVAIEKAAASDPELRRALEAMRAGEEAIEEATKHDVVTLKAAPVSTTVEARGAEGTVEVVEERTEFKLLVLRSKQRVQVVVQPRRQDRFAAAAVYLPDHPQRGLPQEPGEHGLHFEVGSPERVRGVVARVVVTLSDSRQLNTDVTL